jgi:hypothetical protein
MVNAELGRTGNFRAFEFFVSAEKHLWDYYRFSFFRFQYP